MNQAPPISNGARLVKESRIRRLTIEAIRHKAVNLAQAFPDNAPPTQFVDALVSAAKSDRHQYTDTWGAYETRLLVSSYIQRFHPSAAPDPNRNVLITMGAMEAMNDALFVALDPGDEAIVLEPFYECFVAQIFSRHGVPRFVRLSDDGEGGFSLDLNLLESAFTNRTRAVIINTPSNPSGKVLSHADMEGVLGVCRRRGAWLISDETYEHIYFDGNRPVSIIDVDPNLTNSVLLSGFGKTFSVTGWRLGYLVANEDFLRYVRPPHDVNTICAVSHVQTTISALVNSPDSYYQQLREEYGQRRHLLSDGLRKLGFTINRIEGAYYVFAQVPRWWGGSGAELNTELIEGGFVAGVPGEVFYGPGGQQIPSLHFLQTTFYA